MIWRQFLWSFLPSPKGCQLLPPWIHGCGKYQCDLRWFGDVLEWFKNAESLCVYLVKPSIQKSQPSTLIDCVYSVVTRLEWWRHLWARAAPLCSSWFWMEHPSDRIRCFVLRVITGCTSSAVYPPELMHWQRRSILNFLFQNYPTESHCQGLRTTERMQIAIIYHRCTHLIFVITKVEKGKKIR